MAVRPRLAGARRGGGAAHGCRVGAPPRRMRPGQPGHDPAPRPRHPVLRGARLPRLGQGERLLRHGAVRVRQAPGIDRHGTDTQRPRPADRLPAAGLGTPARPAARADGGPVLSAGAARPRPPRGGPLRRERGGRGRAELDLPRLRPVPHALGLPRLDGRDLPRRRPAVLRDHRHGRRAGRRASRATCGSPRPPARSRWATSTTRRACSGARPPPRRCT